MRGRPLSVGRKRRIASSPFLRRSPPSPLLKTERPFDRPQILKIPPLPLVSSLALRSSASAAGWACQLATPSVQGTLRGMTTGHCSWQAYPPRGKGKNGCRYGGSDSPPIMGYTASDSAGTHALRIPVGGLPRAGVPLASCPPGLLIPRRCALDTLSRSIAINVLEPMFKGRPLFPLFSRTGSWARCSGERGRRAPRGPPVDASRSPGHGMAWHGMA